MVFAPALWRLVHKNMVQVHLSINDDFLLNIARRPWIDWMNKVRILIANFSRLDLRLCCFESYILSLVGG